MFDFSTLTMEQLLESLTKKAKQEAEESHRALVAAVNGQAGLDIINQQVLDFTLIIHKLLIDAVLYPSYYSN